MKKRPIVWLMCSSDQTNRAQRRSSLNRYVLQSTITFCVPQNDTFFVTVCVTCALIDRRAKHLTRFQHWSLFSLLRLRSLNRTESNRTQQNPTEPNRIQSSGHHNCFFVSYASCSAIVMMERLAQSLQIFVNDIKQPILDDPANCAPNSEPTYICILNPLKHTSLQ